HRLRDPERQAKDLHRPKAKTQRAPNGTRGTAGEVLFASLRCALHGLRALFVQILGDELDQLSRQREQLTRSVSAGTELLVERPRQDARACGSVEGDRPFGVSCGSLRGELFGHIAPRGGRQQSLVDCNLSAEDEVSNISRISSYLDKSCCAMVRSSPRVFRTNDV